MDVNEQTTVVNLRTGAEQIYTTDAVSAVIAAYAQARGDYNTWDYRQRYEALVTRGPSGRTVACGDFAASI